MKDFTPVSFSTLVSEIPELLASRASLPERWKGLSTMTREALSREALPLYSNIKKGDVAEFEKKLNEAIDFSNADSLLSLIRGAFSEFLYDEFSQLESHYCDLLYIIFNIVGGGVKSFQIRPGVIEVVTVSQFSIFYTTTSLHLIFNLRGSAEEAFGKAQLPAAEEEERIGVSFSAFDRTIDRWVRLTTTTHEKY